MATKAKKSNTNTKAKQSKVKQSKVKTPKEKQSKGKKSEKKKPEVKQPKPVQPTHDELSDYWIQIHPDTIHGLGRFLRYSKHEGIWKDISRTKVEGETLEVLISQKRNGIRPTHPFIRSVYEINRIITTVPNELFDRSANLLVFKNGTIFLDSNPLTINPHSKENFAITSLPYAFNPNAKAETWFRVLSRLSPDVVSFLQEYFGYCLTRETKHEIAVWLNGPSGSGKSSIIAGLQAMAGSMAAQLSLSDMERSHFSLPLIVGKNIIYSTEQFTFSPTVVDNLNKIISGEILNIEEKYEKPYNYRPYAKLLWASTDLPQFPSGDGIFRRFKVIHIPPLSIEDQNLDIKYLISREGPGIMNWALEGLRRLEKRGRFDIPLSVKSASEQFESANDTIQEFIDARCHLAIGVRTQASVLQDAYREWCIANGYQPMSNVKLAEQRKKRRIASTTINGRRYWVGIGLQSVPVFEREKEELIYSLN